MKKIILLLCFILAIPAMAYQELKIIITAGPGGLQEQAVRAIQSELSLELGYPVVLELRPGGKGKIAIQELINQTNTARLAIMISTISFLVEEDHKNIVPFSFYGTTATFLATKNKITWDDILNHCRVDKHINYGSTGNNSPPHILILIADKTCKNPMQHIPYKGIAPAVTDLLGGQIDLIAAALPALSEQVSAGNIKLLGTLGAVKSVQFENLPSLTGPMYKNVDPMEIYFYSTTSADQIEMKKIAQALDKVYTTEKFKNFIKSRDIVRSNLEFPINEHYRRNWAELHQIIADNPSNN